MTHTADINPSEDDRESIMKMLELALRDAEAKIKEVDTILHKSKQKLSAEETAEYEKEIARYKLKVTHIEDAYAKTERTSGHTLKRAFNKKLLDSVQAVFPETQMKELESVLERNGLLHHHPHHVYGQRRRSSVAARERPVQMPAH